MKTIIYDISNEELLKFNFNDNNYFINAKECINHCIGCFSCWIKHPKKCMYNDNYSNITDYLKNSNELILISKNRFGSYSSNIKRVLERCIGYVLPYFVIRDNEIHHQVRYNKDFKISGYFYGDITEDDKKCLYELIKRNAINLNANNFEIKFIKENLDDNAN